MVLPIAEYREFKKPNELGDVGYAKPIETQTETIQEPTNDTQQESDDQYHAFDDVVEQPLDFGETVH